MKARFLSGLSFFICLQALTAQHRCGTVARMQRAMLVNPSLQANQQRIEQFIRIRVKNTAPPISNGRPADVPVIRIPVIVHIVYHQPEENIPDEAVASQLAALNRDYRRNNADSVNTPDAFKTLAADCKIEFELAKVDPAGRASNGIERIYSPIDKWVVDNDNVKFAAEYGAGGWDSRYYLNIWVCNLDDLLGYSSLLGDDPKRDGVVINYTVFNNLDDGGPFNGGRTAVHEIGHWLSLKHLWGDADCGDDDVPDTPRQSTFTTGCPDGVRVSCNNSPAGDMYMNFMDYTNDPCMNLFTNGQNNRVRVLFGEGGPRNSILTSKALDRPWREEIPLPEDSPRWLYPKLYPNPAQATLTIDFKYDPRWVGQELVITNVTGQVIIRHVIYSTVETIDIGELTAGIYFVGSYKDSKKLAEKFIKLQ